MADRAFIPESPYISQENNFWNKLQQAVARSDKRLRHFRASRVQALRAYAGGHYGETKQRFDPLNMMFSAISVIVPTLAARSPRVRIRARRAELRASAYSKELAMNNHLREIDFRRSLRKMITDSVFAVAINKTGLAPGRDVEIMGYLHDIGTPFSDPIDLDDYRVDPVARHREEAVFEGNRYRLPLEYIKDTMKNTDGLKPKYDVYGNQGAEKQASETVSGTKDRINELVEYGSVDDLWIPAENIIVTLPPEGQGNKPLQVVDWEGPERGPYEMLGYAVVPNNLMPLAPVQVWQDLHTLINTMARKLKRQGERQKVVLAYEQQAAEDAKRIIGSDDGETVMVDNIDRVLWRGATGGLSIRAMADTHVQSVDGQYRPAGRACLRCANRDGGLGARTERRGTHPGHEGLCPGFRAAYRTETRLVYVD